jgi:hypothetical protein
LSYDGKHRYAGSEISKQLPCGLTGRYLTPPPCSRAMRRTIARPSPAPRKASDLWTVQYVFFIDAHPFFALDGANYIRCLILFDARQHPVLRMGFLRVNHAAIENSYRVWFTAS